MSDSGEPATESKRSPRSPRGDETPEERSKRREERRARRKEKAEKEKDREKDKEKKERKRKRSCSPRRKREEGDGEEVTKDKEKKRKSSHDKGRKSSPRGERDKDKEKKRKASPRDKKSGSSSPRSKRKSSSRKSSVVKEKDVEAARAAEETAEKLKASVARLVPGSEKESGSRTPSPSGSPGGMSGTRPHALQKLTHSKFSKSIAAATPATYYRCGSSDMLFQNIEQAKKTIASKKPIVEASETIPDRVLTHIPYPETVRLQKLRILGCGEEEAICPPGDEWKAMRDHLHKEGRLEKSAALHLIAAARAHLEVQPNLLELSPPITLCGDIHGQFYDLCKLIDDIGHPKDIQYLFLGDYVDRGDFSTEVCFFLFSMMLSHPKSFFMLRGNHECRLLTTNFNFRRECYYKYDEEVYDAIMDCFDALPIAALITSNVAGVSKRYFACHGGLSPELHDIQQVTTLDRMVEPPDCGILCDLLWSDPMPEDETIGMSASELEDWKNMTFRPNVTRGCAWEFGQKALEEFVTKNNIDCIMRAHEVKRVGYEEHYFHQYDRTSPQLITVFSAPNYCDMYENRAAYLNILSSGEYKFGQISWSAHPYCLPNFEDVFTFSYPFVQECVAQMYVDLLDWLGVDDEDKERLMNVSETYSMIQQRRKARQQRITAIKTVLLSSKDGFDQALKIDQTNERRPGISFNPLDARAKFAVKRSNTW
eukprot:CAMPEP_0114624812 /NCGR_PEP_ID=MMETSP0168-20121206/10954_1 /TAXON_ID=95228 ORGANISM="Vannella sp., Strain DIVA3 517/6/12" /NCGR_SAMPLE_ID=MMETSP0168 /ASSEMBLY_ACC=CAM_ASM_000044 /LENGTH=709 /DNA_ID=CAMNT_0001836087 /DNA_START=59 /DNA_END=2185 /DNA_ORIENTATION=-